MSAVTETLSSNTSTAALQVIGHFNLSLSGTWSATVTIQRSWDKSTWFDVDTFTSNYEGTGFDAEEVYIVQQFQGMPQAVLLFVYQTTVTSLARVSSTHRVN